MQQEMHSKMSEMLNLVPALSQESLEIKKRLSLLIQPPDNTQSTANKAGDAKVTNAGKKRAREQTLEEAAQYPAKKQATGAQKTSLANLAKKYTR